MNTFLVRPSIARGALLCGLSAMTLPIALAGCGSPQQQTPVSQAPMQQPAQPRQSAGVNTKQKLTLLAGAAALYFLYNKFKNDNAAKLQNQQVQYYLSKNGRVYYREPGNPNNVIWVTPPPQQAPRLQIPAEQANAYSRFRGYEGQNTGQTLADVFPVR